MYAFLFEQADQQLGWSSIPRPTTWGLDGEDKSKEAEGSAPGGLFSADKAEEGPMQTSAGSDAASEAGLGQQAIMDATKEGGAGSDERKGGIWGLADLQLPDGFASMDD